MEKYLNYQRKLEKDFAEHGLETYAARIIIATVLGCRVSEIIQHLDEVITNENLEKINAFAYEYISGRPVQYVVNTAYFYNLELYVDESVLIPRPETEELVEWILNEYPDETINIVDAGCGSGCISLALKFNRPNWNVFGTDISKSALIVSAANAESLGLMVEYSNGNFLTPLIDKGIHLDVIVSNPPYIAPNDPDVSSVVKNYEPQIALFTHDKDGLEYYRVLLNQLSGLNFRAAYFEFGYKQKEKLAELIESFGFNAVFKQDISKKDRMVKITKV